MLYEKYIYISRLIYDNKNTLFEHDEIYMHIQKFIRMHMTELHLLNKYTTSRAMLYNDFKNKSYEILSCYVLFFVMILKIISYHLYISLFQK